MDNVYVGEIRIFSMGFAPKGWALCNGQLLSIQQNQALFSLLGTTYGGNGTTTFQLPDLRGRVALNAGRAPSGSTYNLGQNAGTENVTLLINNLPQPPSEKQYQLWALLDGQPIDLGVFDYDVREKRLLVRMKNVQNAQAFAITLERRGRPNQEKPEGQIYVVGNL